MIENQKIDEFRQKENFPVASLLIPKHARAAIRALYKFARSADEISDDHKLYDEVRRQELQKIYDLLKAGDVNALPYNYRAFLWHCREGDMNVKNGLGLLEAFIQDTEKKRYDNWEETLNYCRRSAATIGRCVLEATREFGADHSSADKICIVLQLINHLQDIKSDYIGDNRIYFDSTLINPEEIGRNEETKEFTRGKKEIIGRLREMLYSSSNIFSTINSIRVRAEIAAIFNISEMLLYKLENENILSDKRVELSRAEKRKATLKGINWAFHVSPNSKYSSSGLAILSKSSFIKPLLTLAKTKRRAMLCFYSFCRLVDDSVDNAPNNAAAILRLNQWHEEIDKIYSDDSMALPNHPVSRELALYVRKYDIAKKDILEIIEGQQMDVSGVMNSPSDEMLEEYCYRVASCVGLVSIQIFGYKPENREKVRQFAIDLGKGLQLINMIRDVKEDARNGRIYLPSAILDKHLFKPSPQEIFIQYETLRFDMAPVLQDIALRAEAYFQSSMNALPPEENENMKPALLMMKVYQEYLRKMRASGFIFNKSDIKLSAVQKLKLFLRA